MRASNILVTGNLVFVIVNYGRAFVQDREAKYMAGSIGGTMYPDEVYTLTEIMTEYPHVKEASGFLDVAQVYKQTEG